jgi:hypothetical protein
LETVLKRKSISAHIMTTMETVTTCISLFRPHTILRKEAKSKSIMKEKDTAAKIANGGNM